MICNKTMKRGLVGGALVLVAIVMLAGCAVLGPKPTPEEHEAAVRARVVLTRLENQNEGIKSFKGIGRIKIWQQGRLQINQRLAWIGSLPDRLSIVVLVSGFAAVKMATDGKWLYYYEARGNPPVYRKFRARDASLKRIISVEIEVSDILTLMAGRVPLRDYQQALLIDDSPGKHGVPVLILKKRWQGIIEKIFLDENQSQVQHIEFLNASGKLNYRVRFERMHMLNGYRVPSQLVLSNAEGTEVVLEISRLLTDIDVTDSMFIIAPPN